MRPTSRRILTVMALNHPLLLSHRYQRPNDGANNGAADDPATDAARAGPDCGPNGNANSRPNAYVSTATKHRRPTSVIDGLGVALCPMIPTSGVPTR